MDIQNFYFRDKSVQKSFRFKVSVINDSSVKIPDLGDMPTILNYHVLDVTIPNWEFKKETLKVGPFVNTFPVLNFEGFEFSITFEEDTQGTITRFIDWCQRRIMDTDGLYFNPGLTKIRSIMIETLDDQGDVNFITTFQDCYFLKASELKHDYGSNESVKYEITFNSDLRQVLNRSRGVSTENEVDGIV